MQDSHRQIIAVSAVLLFTLMQFLVLAVFGYTPYPDSEGYIYLAKECVSDNQFYPIASKLNEYPFLSSSSIASIPLLQNIAPRPSAIS